MREEKSVHTRVIIPFIKFQGPGIQEKTVVLHLCILP